MAKLPIISTHDLLTALQRAGFEQTRQKGSHIRLKHPDGRITTVPVHSGKDLGRGLLKKILRDVEWTVDDLIDFLHN